MFSVEKLEEKKEKKKLKRNKDRNSQRWMRNILLQLFLVVNSSKQFENEWSKQSKKSFSWTQKITVKCSNDERTVTVSSRKWELFSTYIGFLIIITLLINRMRRSEFDCSIKSILILNSLWISFFWGTWERRTPRAGCCRLWLGWSPAGWQGVAWREKPEMEDLSSSFNVTVF